MFKNDYYELVKRHLKNRRLWNTTIKKFPPACIKHAVNSLIRSIDDPQKIDWGASFENLRDFDSLSEFLDFVKSNYFISERDQERGIVVDQIISWIDQLDAISDRKYLLLIKRKLDEKLYGAMPTVINSDGKVDPFAYIEWLEWERQQAEEPAIEVVNT